MPFSFVSDTVCMHDAWRKAQIDTLGAFSLRRDFG
jgi:hypothetical protein